MGDHRLSPKVFEALGIIASALSIVSRDAMRLQRLIEVDEELRKMLVNREKLANITGKKFINVWDAKRTLQTAGHIGGRDQDKNIGSSLHAQLVLDAHRAVLFNHAIACCTGIRNDMISRHGLTEELVQDSLIVFAQTALIVEAHTLQLEGQLDILTPTVPPAG